MSARERFGCPQGPVNRRASFSQSPLHVLEVRQSQKSPHIACSCKALGELPLSAVRANLVRGTLRASTAMMTQYIRDRPKLNTDSSTALRNKVVSCATSHSRVLPIYCKRLHWSPCFGFELQRFGLGGMAASSDASAPTLRLPLIDDFHLHLRDGEAMAALMAGEYQVSVTVPHAAPSAVPSRWHAEMNPALNLHELFPQNFRAPWRGRL